MTVLLVLLHPDDAALVPTARRLAVARGRALKVLCATPNGDARRRRTVTPDAARDGEEPLPETVVAALEAVTGSAEDAPGGDVEVIDLRASDLRRAILIASDDFDADELMLVAPPEDATDARRALVRRLARGAPDDVVVVDLEGLDAEGARRVLVPQFGGGAGHALRVGLAGLAREDAPVLALPDPARLARARRVFRRAVERSPRRHRDRLSQAEAPAGGLEAALRETIEPGDLVLLDAETDRKVPAHLAALRALRTERDAGSFAVAVVRAEDASGPGRVERLLERVRTYVPALSRDERKALHERLESGGSLSTDFVVLLMLSTAIASLGLVQSSTAVVIGAMLVAPLMTPLVAAGLSLVQGNLALFRAALRAMSLGVLGGLALAFLVGLLSPWDELSGELLARGAPNLLDLGIALLSGMAAAYAVARPGLAGSLVGVAIAVALVPPLATVGIALAKGATVVATGAAVLLATNFFAIVAGAAMTFRLFGLQVARRGDDAPRWVRAVIASLLVGTAAVSLPLVLNLTVQMRSGVSRPVDRPLPRSLRAAIEARLDAESSVELISMSESIDDARPEAVIVLLCSGPFSSRLVADLEDLVRAEMGTRVGVRILPVRSAGPFGGD